jgi:uncharacterized membrane protein
MNRLIELKDRITERLPILGILAFSLCSVNSVAHLFTANAKNPTDLLWVAAGLVEVTTAWIVHQVVDNGRKVTRSNISKQDKRFYGSVLVAFVILAIPSLSLSIAANTLEFGTIWLGIQFPLLSVACAVGSAVPFAVSRFEKAKERGRQETERKRKDKEKEKLAEEAAAELDRERQELERQQLELERQRLEGLGKEAETLRHYAGNPAATQAETAEMLGVSERTVRNHLGRLEALGLVSRDNGGVEVLVELPASDNSRGGD